MNSSHFHHCSLNENKQLINNWENITIWYVPNKDTITSQNIKDWDISPRINRIRLNGLCWFIPTRILTHLIPPQPLLLLLLLQLLDALVLLVLSRILLHILLLMLQMLLRSDPAIKIRVLALICSPPIPHSRRKPSSRIHQCNLSQTPTKPTKNRKTTSDPENLSWIREHRDQYELNRRDPRVFEP